MPCGKDVRHRFSLRLVKLAGLAGLALVAGPLPQAQAWWEWTSDGSAVRRRFVDGLYQPVTADPYSSAYYNHPAYRYYPWSDYRYGPSRPVSGIGYRSGRRHYGYRSYRGPRVIRAYY